MRSKKYLMIHADDASLSWAENKATQQGMIMMVSAQLVLWCHALGTSIWQNFVNLTLN